MKKLTLIFLFSFSYSILYSQVLYRKMFAGIKIDYSDKIIRTYDGGFLMTSSNCPNGGSPFMTNLVKIDNLGNMLWTKEISSSYSFIVYSVKQSPDSGFVLCGYYNGVPFNTEQSIFLIKTDSTGNLLWLKKYVSSDKFLGLDLVITNDNGIMVLGMNQGPNTNKQNISLLKTDSLGQFVWAKTLYGTTISSSRQLLPTSDGGFLISGSSNCQLLTTGGGLLIKLDSNGDTLWTKAYASPSVSFFYETVQSFDGSYITIGLPIQVSDPYFVISKIDSSLNIVWSQKIQVAPGKMYPTGVTQMTDSTIIISGYIQYNPNLLHAFAFNMDESGSLLWSKKYINGLKSTFTNVLSDNNNGFIAFGTIVSTASSTTFDDLYLVKANSQGQSVCNDSSFSCSLLPLTYTTLGNCNLTIIADTLIESNIILSTNSYFSDSTICTSVVGTNELINNKVKLAIYPNPNNGNLTINYKILFNESTKLEVFDVMNKSVYKTELLTNSNTKQINLSFLSKGLYVCKVGNDVVRFVKE